MISPAPSPVIALLTDFGSQDWYVAAMKGEILARLPGATLLDITHAIPPQQVLAGRFVLGEVLGSLPRGTIICAVVDPGVGSTRRALCGWIGGFGWSGPDNGLLTPLLDRPTEHARLHLIASPRFQAERATSSTFHGRDLFAPAAAALALGLDPALAGPPVTDPLRLDLPQAEPAPRGWRLRVLWVDRFGNLVTNLRSDHAGTASPVASQDCVFTAGTLQCRGIRSCYAEAEPGEPLAYWGSGGWLELAVRGGSAAAHSGLGIGDPVELIQVLHE